MGVIKCRRREASLIPSYIYELVRRRNVTTVVLDSKGVDAASVFLGMNKTSGL